MKQVVELWKAKTRAIQFFTHTSLARHLQSASTKGWERDALENLLALGLRKENIGNIEFIWGSFGHSDPEALRAIMPHVTHMHGKFFEMKDGVEPNVRFEEVVKVLAESGYNGWISSEYEGAGGLDTFDLVRQQQALIRRSWESALKN